MGESNPPHIVEFGVRIVVQHDDVAVGSGELRRVGEELGVEICEGGDELVDDCGSLACEERAAFRRRDVDDEEVTGCQFELLKLVVKSVLYRDEVKVPPAA